MSLFRVDVYGIESRHAPDYVVDHCHVSKFENNQYELLCFATQAIILTAAGMELAEIGDVILHSPDFRIHHYTPPGAREGFVNDYLYINSDDMPEFITRMRLPLNRLIRAGDPMLLHNALLEVQDELLKRRAFYEEKISVLVTGMLVSVARAAIEQHQRLLPCYASLMELRQEMMNHYSRPWTIRLMADRLNLSCSRFSVLYREQFGISPINDLIEMRLRAARVMLKGTPMSLRQIALECGFQNEYYFSKVFKGRIGVSPSRYRGRVNCTVASQE